MMARLHCAGGCGRYITRRHVLKHPNQSPSGKVSCDRAKQRWLLLLPTMQCTTGQGSNSPTECYKVLLVHIRQVLCIDPLVPDADYIGQLSPGQVPWKSECRTAFRSRLLLRRLQMGKLPKRNWSVVAEVHSAVSRLWLAWVKMAASTAACWQT